MEEIKLAGGIGCFEKGAEDAGFLQSEVPAADFSLPGNSTKASGRNQYSEKTHRPDKEYRDFEDDASRDYDQRKRGSHSNHGHRDDQKKHGPHSNHGHWDDQRKSSSRHRSDRVYYSRSPERSRSYSQSHRQHSHRMERDDVDQSRSKHQGELSPRKSKKSKYYDDESDSASNSRDKDNMMRRDKDRRHRNLYSDRYSGYNMQNAIVDRYDPSESHDSR